MMFLVLEGRAGAASPWGNWQLWVGIPNAVGKGESCKVYISIAVAQSTDVTHA
jgi:hypothetical protein